MHPAFQRTDHRPWGHPVSPWAWRQSWCDLLFAHWPISAEDVRELVPAELEIDEFDGTSWIGVVPFRMEGVMKRPLPDLPWISAFCELNLRLYVSYEDQPGVWFLSLDAANPLAVWAARKFFHLPYFWSNMQLSKQDSTVSYESVRKRDPQGLEFRATYKPTSEPYESTPGTLENWLTERYCLYASAPDERLFRAEVHHVPWPLQAAEADIQVNELLLPHGLKLSNEPELLHFSSRIDVVVWSPEQVN